MLTPTAEPMPIAPQMPSGMEGCRHEGAAGAGSATAMPGSTPAARPGEHTPWPACLSAHWLAQRGTPAFNPAPRCYSVLKSLAGCVSAAASPGTPQHSPAPAQHNGDEHRNELAGWLMQHAGPVRRNAPLTGSATSERGSQPARDTTSPVPVASAPVSISPNADRRVWSTHRRQPRVAAGYLKPFFPYLRCSRRGVL